ncbi:DUF2971 domain-containing protein [Bacillus altitudinis]|uniref:DUF2971 domain-containing protein n=1 Tax=Bacillus altitudinis TaxID=293387 RepID=UPI003F7C45A3
MDFNEVNELLSRHLDTPNDTPPLYHYTSVYGLEGIMDKGEVWVSHTDFLNDKTERLYSGNIIVELIEKKFKAKAAELVKDLKDYPPLNNLLDKIREVFQIKNVPTFVLSLSTNKDSNLLWSNYSKDDGYNIEFDPDFFEEDIQVETDNIKGATLFKSKVIYDEEKHFLALSELADKYVEHFFMNRNQSDEDFGSTLQKMHLAHQVMAAFFKDSCFQQEEEWRIVLFVPIKNIPIEHRIMNGAFIPYVKLSFDKKLIKGVTIGPKNKMDISEEGLKSFLNTKGYNLNRIEIKRSKIPYRY